MGPDHFHILFLILFSQNPDRPSRPVYWPHFADGETEDSRPQALCPLENQPRLSGYVETHESTQSPLRQCWFALLGGVAQHPVRAPTYPDMGSGKLIPPEGLRNSTLNSHLFSKLSHTLFFTCIFLLSTGIQKNQI